MASGTKAIERAVTDISLGGDARAALQRIGLEDGAEIIAQLTSEQLAVVLDDDLWPRQRFDPERFVTWLEVMRELGDKYAADRLAELDEDLVTLGFQKNVHVVAKQLLDWNDELEDVLSLELEGHFILAKAPRGWDALINVMLELDQHHSALFGRILARCESDMPLLEDVAGEREDRRERAGFIDPRSAKHFLTLCARDPDFVDPISARYLKNLQPRPARPVVPDELRRALPAPKPLKVRAAIARLDPEQAQKELAFLANVLVSAKDMRPADAAEEVLRICEAGLNQDESVLTWFKRGYSLTPAMDARSRPR